MLRQSFLIERILKLAKKEKSKENIELNVAILQKQVKAKSPGENVDV